MPRKGPLASCFCNLQSTLPWSWGQVVAPFFGNIPTARVNPRQVRLPFGETWTLAGGSERKVRTPSGQDSRQETLSRRHGWPQGRRPEALPLKPGHGGSSRRDGQCHRENTASSEISDLRFEMTGAARVKRWGKSPPRRQRCRWQGKPNPVQDKIGDWAARPTVPGMSHPASAGRPRERLREMTINPGASRGTESGLRPQDQGLSPGALRGAKRLRARGEKPLDLPGSVGMFDPFSSRPQLISHHPWPTPNPPSRTPANP